MKRLLLTAGLMTLAAVGVGVIGCVEMDYLMPGRPGSVSRREDFAPGGYEMAALVFGFGLLLRPVAVIVGWARQSVAAGRRVAARIEAEAPLLEDYGHGELHERRTGQGPVRPDAVANQAA